MFYKIFENEQFNFQVNRVLIYMKDSIALDEVKEIAPRIKDFDSWIYEWNKLGDKANDEGRYLNAFYYYRMAEFYMLGESDEKDEYYKKLINCFLKVHENEKVERFEIPFENGAMPAYKMTADNEKGIVVVSGGFDSFIEEFYPLLSVVVKKGYTVICYEGPGQGGARKNGLAFRYDWEVPVSAVLDYFNLKDVTLMGISWGGYLAPRAAAFEKRIKNVICYDIFYKGLDALSNRMPAKDFAVLESMLKLNQKSLINKMIQKKMKGNIDLTWKMNQGMYITDTKTPYDFIKSIEKHDLSKAIDKITQNVLLLAGENDQYVPVKRFEQIKKELVNAKSVTGRVFTKEENADQHCQVGNIKLAIDYMLEFMDKYN